MMFDIVKLRAEVSFRNSKGTRELVFHITHSRSVCEAILSLAKHAETRSRVQNLLVQVGRRIAGDTDVVNVFKPHIRRFETITDRLLGETRAVLDAIETLFLGCGD